MSLITIKTLSLATEFFLSLIPVVEADGDGGELGGFESTFDGLEKTVLRTDQVVFCHDPQSY